MQFSLDRKRRSHKQNQCSASDSVGLIFTRSYHFTLLITPPTTTPSLVKTSLKKFQARLDSEIKARFLLNERGDLYFLLRNNSAHVILFNP